MRKLIGDITNGKQILNHSQNNKSYLNDSIVESLK